jgi:excisionase family DNA binding protein
MAEKTTVSWDNPADEVITARLAAKEKGVHPVSIYRAVKEGRLKGSRSGNTILIRRRDLADWTPVGHRPRAMTAGARTAPMKREEITEEEARRIQREKNEPLIQLLRSWRTEGDPEEQRETWEYLKKALDEDRMSSRKLFPDE